MPRCRNTVKDFPFTIGKPFSAYFWRDVKSVSIYFVWTEYCISHKI